MIDTNQLSALVSAFQFETEKESISLETVGKLFQDILDLHATAGTLVNGNFKMYNPTGGL